ncbi:MAG TPA: DUF4232 domain-containing protein [Actinophytocola sp.]|jgi:hypothetical protein|nr:DUF4232 domain-containing protein [Actinophytocola sp.]
MHITSRGARGVLVAVGAAALLAGCGYQPQQEKAAAATVTETVSGEQPDTSVEDAPAEEPAGDDPAPCTADDISPQVAEGDHSHPEIWSTAVVVTNTGGANCRLEGVGDIMFIARSGDPFDIEQETAGGDGPADDLVIIGPEEQASMYVSYPSASGETDDCSGPISAQVRLPGDQQSFEVETPATMETMPPLCHGPISVSPFAYGGFE